MSAVSRQPKGVPVGGQFAQQTHAEVDIVLIPAEEPPPLRDYRVVGFTRKETRPTPDVCLPGSTCWHCGAGIINCVQARHIETGEVIDVGMDCAERTGLDKANLKAMLAEKYREEREARNSARSAASRTAAAEREAEQERLHGAHGSETRFAEGRCRCEECLDAAPHGTIERLEHSNCYCTQCVEAAVEDGPYRVEEKELLVDATTGRTIPEARVVSTRFGLRWVVDTDAGTEWYPVGPKRRSTLLTKGVLEAPAKTLVRVGRERDWPVACLEQPVVDSWGEPIVVPANT